jgi:hypothetical protein
MGTRNIDLAIISPQLIRSVLGWAISDQESVSDHSIIKYDIGPGIDQWKTDKIQNTRYITNKENLAKFQRNLLQIVKTQLGKNQDTGAEDLDATLSSIISEDLDIEKRIDEFCEVIIGACNKSFPTHGATKKEQLTKQFPGGLMS